MKTTPHPTGRSLTALALTLFAAAAGAGPALADDVLTIEVPHRAHARAHASMSVLKVRLALIVDDISESPTFELDLAGNLPVIGEGQTLETGPPYDHADPLARVVLPNNDCCGDRERDPAECCEGRECMECEVSLGPDPAERELDRRRRVLVALRDEAASEASSPTPSVGGRAVHYTLWIRPEENGRNCMSDMVGDETWRLVVRGARIEGACLEAFQQPIEGCHGDSLLSPAAADGLYPHYADLPGGMLSTPTHTCAGWRPPVDLAFVVDVSGSMAERLAPDAAVGITKIDATRSALLDFAAVWTSLRAAEVVECDDALAEERLCDSARDRDDRLGVVPFAGDARVDESALGLLPMSEWGDGRFGRLVDGLEAGGLTSIGDGLIEAIGPRFLDLEHRDEARRPVVVILSDGKANQPAFVMLDEHDQRLKVAGIDRTYRLLSDPLAIGGFEHLADFDEAEQVGYTAQIYAITVGWGNNVDSTLAKRLSRASGGAYHHLDPAELTASSLNPFGDPSDDYARIRSNDLRRFFMHTLQNLLQFNTWRVVRELRTEAFGSVGVFDIAGVHPDDYEAASGEFRLPSTAHAVAVIAMYDDRAAPDAADRPLEVVIEPPSGYAAPPPAQGAGLVHAAMQIERTGAPRVRGARWRVRVRQSDGDVPVPVHVLVLVDTLATDATTTVRSADVAIAESVVVETRLSVFGQPVVGLRPGAIRASVQRPVSSIGTLMAHMAPDTRRAIREALDAAALESDAGNLLAALYAQYFDHDPDAAERELHGFTLRDDGVAPDAVADDGVYTGAFTPLRPGHYQIVTTTAAEHPAVGGLDFQHVETIYVRDRPLRSTFVATGTLTEDADLTIADTPIDGGVRRSIVYRPTNANGDLLGPGYDGRFVVLDDGAPRLMLDDDLDGIYEVTVDLTYAEATVDGTPGGAPRPPEVLYIDRPIPVFVHDPVELWTAAAAAALAPDEDGEMPGIIHLGREPIGVDGVDGDGDADELAGDAHGDGSGSPGDGPRGDRDIPGVESDTRGDEDEGCDCNAAAPAPGGPSMILVLCALGLLRRRRGRC